MSSNPVDESAGAELPGERPRDDWFERAWQSLPDRSRIVLSRRLAGETLERIAQSLDLTRERVRQVQRQAEAALVKSQRRYAPDLSGQLLATVQDEFAVPDLELSKLHPTRAIAARDVIFRQLGVVHPTAWSVPLDNLWTCNPDALDSRLRALAGLAPMTHVEAQQAAVDIGLPAWLAIDEFLQRPESKLLRHVLGWLRSFRAGRDLAYLWLRERGEPQLASDIAEVVGTSEHAIRETMRRDDAFVQVRPEGTWALKDWRVQSADRQYASAVDVVADVLGELGPLTFAQLSAEAIRRYPVTSWRITQCLSNSMFGRNADGLYDLTEHGAIPVEDTEPKRPKTIEVHGQVVGIQLDVTHDLLRGSGLGINRWLTWYLGLRIAPSAKYFAMDEDLGTLSVKRGTSVSQISSLRVVAQTLGLTEGCKLVVLLRLDTERASFQHACQAGSCPAGRS